MIPASACANDRTVDQRAAESRRILRERRCREHHGQQHCRGTQSRDDSPRHGLAPVVVVVEVVLVAVGGGWPFGEVTRCLVPVMCPGRRASSGGVSVAFDMIIWLYCSFRWICSARRCDNTNRRCASASAAVVAGVAVPLAAVGLFPAVELFTLVWPRVAVEENAASTAKASGSLKDEPRSIGLSMVIILHISSIYTVILTMLER
jgi:hypothetical protein